MASGLIDCHGVRYFGGTCQRVIGLVVSSLTRASGDKDLIVFIVVMLLILVQFIQHENNSGPTHDN